MEVTRNLYCAPGALSNRTEASRQFLRKFSQSGIGFLDRMITTDEKWYTQ
jgi:hypothetical protein